MGLRRLRAALVTGVVVAALLCSALGTGFAFANPGGDNASDAITQALPIVGLTGSLDSTTTDQRDVYKIHLKSGDTLDASMTVSSPTTGTNFDIMLYRAAVVSSIDETNTPPSMWSNGPLYERFTYMAEKTGDYYLDVHAWNGSGNYTLDAKIIPAVKFKVGSLKLQASAKLGKKVPISAVVTPAYNGEFRPVVFEFYRFERGKYRYKTYQWGNGDRNPGEASSKLSVSHRFTKKGKWAVRAVLWDAAHPRGVNSKFKYIKIK